MKSNKPLFILLGILLLCICCAVVVGGAGLIATSMDKSSESGGDNKEDGDDDGEDDEANKTYELVDIQAGLDAANKVAKEKSATATLVQAGDDQGGSDLYFRIGGEEDEQLAATNTTGKAKQWLYVYVTNPSEVVIEDESSLFGKYKAKKDKGFVVKYNSVEGAKVLQDTLFGDTTLHSVADLSEGIKKMGSQAAFDKANEHFKADITKAGYTEAKLTSLNLSYQDITYTTAFYPEKKTELKGIWIVEFEYEDKALEFERRTFKLRIEAKSGELLESTIFPEIK